ncbi:MAG TPA: hypothetical protein VEF04_21395, partial [Blastocatellia bacterium]|nr:hypothetical protein [Blastocatellia bacterium]
MSDHSSQPNDATVPLAQLRREDVAPRQSQPNNTSSGSSRRFPMWALVAGGAAVLLIAVAAASYAMQKNPGFTIVVKNLPPTSEVYVGEIRRGIPLIGQNTDGTPTGIVRVAGLRSGEKYTVRVNCPGGAAELYQDTKKLDDRVTA